MDGFSLNFVCEYFSKICRENSVSLKSDKNEKMTVSLNTDKNYVYLWCLAEFFLEKQVFFKQKL
jgi:hypothetical protein